LALKNRWAPILGLHHYFCALSIVSFKFLGQFGPAFALIAASYTGCNPPLTVALLTIGVGLNGGIYSGFKVNHLDISPRFAGILMSFTNCLANLAGLLAPITAGYVIEGKVRVLSKEIGKKCLK